ncbi:Putative zinc-or iron-chelating domain-containing protein [Rhodoferax sp. OV413]|uniref:YkgJ family cysteine cluster protein n=1 Tax=Rhodoferax sp. OV413 TaxID=1855285 RepID=UPI00088BDB02|nr:YkgJ family cysteine cluster protein [Rhodoferax sp. OV413]SDO73411.1 Putative zinc-or iron-chelating domain-containing protein [Rhodoferax sp. OV413]
MKPPPLALTPEEQAAFLQSVDQVQQAALRGLEAQPGGWAVVAFVRHLQRGVDSVVATVRDQGVRLDCAAGCSHCCHARVEAMAPEIFQIAGELAARPPLEQAETVARLEAYLAVQTQDASPQDAPWSCRPACPFLIDQLCSIYAVRPAACRKAHSRDVAACASDAALIPQSLELAVHAEALQLGTAAAYRQRGLDAQPHELVQAVLLALRDPSALSRWQDGEPVFGVDR